MNAGRSVVFTIGGAVAITALGQLADGKTPRLRVFIGGAGAAIVLSVIAAGAPGIAHLFAVLVLLGAVLGPGYSLLKAASRLIN